MLRRRVGPAMVLVAAIGLISACGGSTSTSTSSTSTAAGGSATSSKGPIVIGAAIDFTNLMKASDGPAYDGARLEVKRINAEGGVDGRKLKFVSQDTKLKPDLTKKAAIDLIGKGAQIGWVTCDVDWSTPAVQQFISKGMLTVSPCIGTDQMGPKRFGDAGKLAFSYGNVAQDEGAAMAATAKKQGWKTADVVTDQQIVYTKNVCDAFKLRFEKLGGKIIDDETFTANDGTIGHVANGINSKPADVIVFCTTPNKDAPTFLSAIRTAGNKTPILSPWSLSGTYWMPRNPKIADNYWSVGPASIYGDDPTPDVNKMVKDLTAEGKAPTKGAFIEGAAAIDGIVAAIKRAGGSTDGAALADQMAKFHALPTISGKVSFSPQYHTVFGREYRVTEVSKDKGAFKYLIEAGTPQEIPSG